MLPAPGEMPGDDGPDGPTWFAVRCVFRDTGETGRRSRRDRRRGEALYEERITLWLAESEDHAFELAEAEARGYAEDIALEYVEFADSYRMERAPHSGAEVFSLMRYSRRGVRRYLDRFFDTGRERRRR